MTDLDHLIGKLRKVVAVEKAKKTVWITAALRSEPPTSEHVKAYRTSAPGLVIHQAPQGGVGWRVSHEDSGFALASVPLPSKEAAEAAVEALKDLADWTRPPEDILSGYVTLVDGQSVVVEGLAQQEVRQILTQFATPQI